MNSKEIISYVAKKRIVKYIQAGELTAFLSCGFCLGRSFIVPGAILFFVGISLAIIAGESAIEETKLDYGLKE